MSSGNNADSSLNKVIHLFASGVDAPRRFDDNTTKVASTLSCCLLSAGGGIVRTFYFCNLGICWSERGLQFSLLDLETRLPTSTYLLGDYAGSPSFADLINPNKPPWDSLYKNVDENCFSINSKSVLRFFTLKKEGAERLSSQVFDAKLCDAFRTLFNESAAGWINLPESLVGLPFLSYLGLNKFVFISRPDLKNIIQTFELMKRIAQGNPDASFALIFHRTSDRNIINAVFSSLDRTVRIELGKSVRLIGHFPTHPAIAESILGRYPLVLNNEYKELKKQFDEISENLLKWAKLETESCETNEIQEIQPHIENTAGQGI